jgi:hypothetical protein
MASEIELLQEIKDLLKNSNRSNYSTNTPSTNSNSNSSSVSGDGPLGKLTGVATGVVEALTNVWRGSSSAAEGLGVFTSALSKNGGILGKVIGDLGSTAINAMNDVNKSNRDSVKYGADWGNNLGEFDKAIKGARMTHEEYNDMLRTSTRELEGAGSNANKTQQNFLSVAKGLQESDLGNRLKQLGVSTDELNQITETSLAFNQGKDLSEKTAHRNAIESAINMAAAMDENTRVSGISRKEQEANLKKQSEKASTQMALSMMDPEAQERYKEAMNQMANAPQAVKDAFTEEFTGGLRTNDGAATIAGMGDAGPELLKAARASAEANSPEARLASQKQNEEFLGKFAEVQNSTSYKQMGVFATGAAADKTREMYTGNLELQKINAKIDEEKNKGNTIDASTARNMLYESAKLDRKGVDEKGEKIKGGELGQTINQADSVLKDIAAGTGSAFNGLVKETNEVIGAESKLTEALRSRTQAEATPAAIGKEIGDAIVKALPFDAGKLADAYEKNRKEFQDSTKNYETLPSAAPKRSTGSPSFESFISGSGGFKDMFESFDPNGELVELHGKELVANESQMNRLFNSISEQMKPDMKNTAATSSELPALNFEDVKNTVATQANAASPQMSEINKTFTAATTQMKDVTKSLGEVADKLKNINFEPALKNLSEHTAKVMEKVAVKPTDTKKEEVKPTDTKKEEPKKEEVKPTDTKKEEPKKEEVKPAETKPVEDKFAALSKTIETVTSEIQTGGIRTKEGAEKMASLGPAGVDLEKAIKAHKDATTDQQKADAINAENTAIAKIKDYQQSKTFIEQQQQHAIITAKAGFKDIDPIKSTEELNKKLFGALKVDGIEKKEQTKEQPKAPEKVEEKKEEKGFFDSVSDAFGKVGSSISGLFKDDKPAFAKGNVTYEEISQEEKDAADKRSQEGIGKVDNSPEAIEAQKAEIERQKNSGRYKEKEPEKPKTDDLKKPADTKEDAHVKDMYKKFGLETFKDYNTRMDAESKVAKPALKPDEVKKDEKTKFGIDTNATPFVNPEEIAKHVASKTLQPDFSKPFANISEQLHGVNNAPMLSHEDIFAKAQDMFKTPDISNVFESASDTMSKMFNENKMFPDIKPINVDQSATDVKPASAVDSLKDKSNAIADSINGLKLPTDVAAPEEKTEDKGFFDTISDTFSKAGSSISDFFKDDKPAVAIEDVKSNPNNQTPEEQAKVAAAIKKLDKGATTRAEAEAEKAKLKDANTTVKESEKPKLKDATATLKEPEKPVIPPAIVKPKSKEDQHVDAMYKKFGIERFDDYNSRKSAEVKSAHAQIKDTTPDRSGITAQDVTPPKPAEQPQPAAQPQPVAPPVVQAPVAKDVTLKDLHDALMQLNKTMGQMAQHTDDISNNSRKQIQATKSITGNRYA